MSGETNIETMIENIRATVGDDLVIGAISGGTDSTVAGTLVARAIGKQFIPVYVESGLMRAGTRQRVEKQLGDTWQIPIAVLEAREIFLARLAGVQEAEAKRKVIGALYIELFEQEMAKHAKVKFLLQGTTLADVLESQGGKNGAVAVKSHHNVGGLPAEMKLQLLEPLRHLHTDQIRELGLALGLSKELVFQQPFPGPGHAIRILGEVTAEKLTKQNAADAIVVEELKKTGWYEQIFQSFAILTNTQSTAMKDGARVFDDVIALRIVTSVDRMTADWARLPHEVLAAISARIVREVAGVSRVVYDITAKPPATMEWE